MDIAVQRIGVVGDRLQNSQKNEAKPNTATTAKDINLNLDSNSIYFKGLFFNRKKQTEESPKVTEPGIYGPDKLTQSQILLSNYEAENHIDLLWNYMASTVEPNNPNAKQIFGRTRAKDSVVDKMVPYCIALFAYYGDTQTSFPQFCDTIVRGFPRACAKSDYKHGDDNATRLHEKTVKRIKELGRKIDPDTQDEMKSGIAYLYFANDIPNFNTHGSYASTEDMFERMNNGVLPRLSAISGTPRCSMSTVPNEINACPIKAIKEKYGERQVEKDGTVIYKNKHGLKRNPNCTKTPKVTQPAPKMEESKEDWWTMNEILWWNPDHPFSR